MTKTILLLGLLLLIGLCGCSDAPEAGRYEMLNKNGIYVFDHNTGQVWRWDETLKAWGPFTQPIPQR